MWDGHSANTKFYKTLSQNFNGKETCITDDGESSDERTPHDLETDETVGSLVKKPVAVKTVFRKWNQKHRREYIKKKESRFGRVCILLFVSYISTV